MRFGYNPQFNFVTFFAVLTSTKENLVNTTPPTILAGSFFKLCRCIYQGMKMCMRFGCNPQINFCHFFRSLNLAIF